MLLHKLMNEIAKLDCDEQLALLEHFNLTALFDCANKAEQVMAENYTVCRVCNNYREDVECAICACDKA